MNGEEASSLVALNLVVIREGIIEELAKGLTIKPPMGRHGSDKDTFVVVVNLSHRLSHITDYVHFSAIEVAANTVEGRYVGPILDLLKAKGREVGFSIREMQARSGARALMWSRTCYVDPDLGWWSGWRQELRGRWTRLRWAWSGFIPIKEGPDV